MRATQRSRVPWAAFAFVCSASAIRWEGPEPTISSAIIGFDPLPTVAPYVAPPNFGSLEQLGLRKRDYSEQLCGTVPGQGGTSSPYAITCTGVCQLQASNIVGCCPDSNGCNFSTACIGSADWERGCSGGGSLTCQSQSNVAICTSSEYPYCGAFGDGTFTMFGCFSTIRVSTREITFKQQIADAFSARSTADEESPTTSDFDDEPSTTRGSGSSTIIDVPGEPAATTGSDNPTSTVVIEKGKDDGGPNIGAIVGGIVGGLAVIVAGVLLALWLVRRNKNKPQHQPVPQMSPGVSPGMTPGMTPMAQSSGQVPMAGGYYSDPAKQPSELQSSPVPQQPLPQYQQNPYGNYQAGYHGMPPAGVAEAPANPAPATQSPPPPQQTAYQQTAQTYELPTGRQ